MFANRFALAAGLVLAGSLLQAEAQSFDCRKAGTAVEKAICDDRKLAALDFDMERAFREVLRRAGPRHAAMMSDQRAWRADRDADCAKLSADAARLASCVADAYRARLAELRTTP